MKTLITCLPRTLCLLSICLLSGCVTTAIKTTENPPDLAELLKNEPSLHAFQVREYHIRHVWSGNKGYPAATPYRALITIFSGGSGAVAELYFHDAGQDMPDSSDPSNKSSLPYQVHFPLSTLDAVLHELRFAKEPVYLFYYQPAHERQWAIGVLRNEEQPGYERP